MLVELEKGKARFLSHTHTKTHTKTQRYDLVIIFFNHPLSSHQLCLTRRPADQLQRVLHDCGWWKQSDGDVEMKAGGERHSIYPTQKSMEDNLAQHFVLFFFLVPSFACQKLIGGCWLFFTGCASVCIYMCVCARVRCVCVCVCDCSRKCRLKRGRWRQMGEVGGRCSEKTWKSTPPPPPLARPQALLARPRVKITQFARSQVTEMQSSRDKKEKGGMGVEDRGR